MKSQADYLKVIPPTAPPPPSTPRGAVCARDPSLREVDGRLRGRVQVARRYGAPQVYGIGRHVFRLLHSGHGRSPWHRQGATWVIVAGARTPPPQRSGDMARGRSCCIPTRMSRALSKESVDALQIPGKRYNSFTTLASYL